MLGAVDSNRKKEWSVTSTRDEKSCADDIWQCISRSATGKLDCLEYKMQPDLKYHTVIKLIVRICDIVQKNKQTKTSNNKLMHCVYMLYRVYATCIYVTRLGQTNNIVSDWKIAWSHGTTTNKK